MQASFWHQRWEENDIGFHESEANSLLRRYFENLNLAKGSRVFLPLCGKTQDLAWLLANGYRVVGAELSELAISQLFREIGIEPAVSRIGALIHYQATDIDIFVGDIFDLSTATLGPVDAVYDRAALVALPENMRNRYTTHLMKITDTAPQLLICYEYDQRQMDGPPFSITTEEVRRHYGDSYHVTLVESQRVPGDLKGQVAAMETAWLLQNPAVAG